MTDPKDSPVPDSLDRRKFVGTLGVLGAVALAGCPDEGPAAPPGLSGPDTPLPPDDEPSGPVHPAEGNDTSEENQSVDGNQSADGNQSSNGNQTGSNETAADGEDSDDDAGDGGE